LFWPSFFYIFFLLTRKKSSTWKCLDFIKPCGYRA
jgi:hypothetical protein